MPTDGCASTVWVWGRESVALYGYVLMDGWQKCTTKDFEWSSSLEKHYINTHFSIFAWNVQAHMVACIWPHPTLSLLMKMTCCDLRDKVVKVCALCRLLHLQTLHRPTCSEGWCHLSVCYHWLTATPATSSWPLSRPRNQEPWMHSVWACREKRYQHKCNILSSPSCWHIRWMTMNFGNTTT